MADKKISQLTTATTPLDGTEVLPIVQSGNTVKVPVASLTLGRNVSVSTLTITGSTIPTNGLYLATTNVLCVSTGGEERVRVDATGRVGVNTDTPMSLVDINGKLTLTGGEDAQLEWSNDGQAWRLNNSPLGRFYLYDATANTFPFSVQAGAPNDALAVDGDGNVQAGGASLATTATDGFLYIPTCAGTPTGTPTAKTNFAPIVVDRTNNKLYVYVGSSWVAMN